MILVIALLNVIKNILDHFEVDTLLGDARKAKKELKWKPNTNIKSLVKEMVNAELKELRKSDKIKL